MAAKKAAAPTAEDGVQQLKAEAKSKQHFLKLSEMKATVLDPVLFERVTMKVVMGRRIIGGTPTTADLISAWVKANMPNVVAVEQEKVINATVESMKKVIEEEAETMYTTFKSDDQGIYIDARQFKAALKESANVLKSILQDHFEGGKKEGERSRFTALKSRVAERIFIVEEKIRLCGPDGKPKMQPDGVEQAAIHVMTPQGPRTALKKYDFCNPGTTLTFELAVLRDGAIDGEVLQKMLDFAAVNGLGSMRSQGNGTFEWAVAPAA